MRIGLFTEMYFPSVNGITYVVDGIYKDLIAQGHEVYIFAPAEGLRHTVARALHLRPAEPHVIRLPSIDGSILFEQFKASIFFPPKALNQIKALNLDVIHFFTPGQIGLLGVYAAKKLNIPLVGQYCTDLFQYVEYYPRVLPGILALSMSVPFSLPYSTANFKEVFQLLLPRRSVTDWNKDIVKEGLTLVHNQCDAVIVPSRKVHRLLEGWHTNVPLPVIPNGVDALPAPTAAELKHFKKKCNLTDKKVILYVGRLTAEKNLTLLIDALERIRKRHSDVVLMYVGSAEFEKNLADYAAAKNLKEFVRFTGRMNREELGVAYAAADVFAFPSLTDTQGLVLHEAAQAGLPLVIVDPGVTEVLQEGRNGFIAKATPLSIANKILPLFDDPALCSKLGRESKKIAQQYSEKKQSKKLIELYRQVVRDHGNKIILRARN